MNKIDILIKSKDLLDVNVFKMYLKILYLKEKETYMHSVRVSLYSTQLAREIGFSDEEVAIVWLSGLLHDMGKLLVPNYILLGTSTLSENEYSLIRMHPTDGVMLIKDFVSDRVCKGALEHHERLDGKGYPLGIKNISLIGKIIAIADTFDAMTSNRTYQNALPFEECLSRMEELSSFGLYDKNLFVDFKKVIERINN